MGWSVGSLERRDARRLRVAAAQARREEKGGGFTPETALLHSKRRDAARRGGSSETRGERRISLLKTALCLELQTTCPSGTWLVTPSYKARCLLPFPE